MFQKTDFWIVLAVGAVSGIFVYLFMQERGHQLAAMQPMAAGQVPLPCAAIWRKGWVAWKL